MKNLIKILTVFAIMVLAVSAAHAASGKRSEYVKPLDDDNATELSWETLFSSGSVPSYYKDKKPVMVTGVLTSSSAISDTDFEFEFASFDCRSGSATIVLSGDSNLSGLTITLFENMSKIISVPIPTISSVTFTNNFIQSGASLQYTISGVEDQ